MDEEALIFVIEDGRSTLLYANDTGALPEETLDFIEQQNIKFDVVSMDTTEVYWMVTRIWEFGKM